MAVIILLSYLSGFERFIQIISKIGPLLICFFIIVGLVVIFKDFDKISEIGHSQTILRNYQSAPNWIFSGFLYFSLAVSAGGTYTSKLGASLKNLKSIKYGSILGCIEVCAAIAIISTAILLNADAMLKVDVPTLYLARKISPLIGSLFTLVLLLGIFSASAATMWSLCKFIYPENPRKNKISATVVSILATMVGMFPFSSLVATILPLMAYIGIFYVICIIYKRFHKK